MRATMLADSGGPILMDREFIVVAAEESDSKRRNEVVTCLNPCISWSVLRPPRMKRACAVRCMETYNCTKITDTKDLLKYQC